MSLTARAKAQRGVGFKALLVATMGLLPVAANPPVSPPAEGTGVVAKIKVVRGVGYTPILKATHGLLLPEVVSVPAQPLSVSGGGYGPPKAKPKPKPAETKKPYVQKPEYRPLEFEFKEPELDLLAIAQTLITSGILECL